MNQPFQGYASGGEVRRRTLAGGAVGMRTCHPGLHHPSPYAPNTILSRPSAFHGTQPVRRPRQRAWDHTALLAWAAGRRTHRGETCRSARHVLSCGWGPCTPRQPRYMMCTKAQGDGCEGVRVMGVRAGSVSEQPASAHTATPHTATPQGAAQLLHKSKWCCERRGQPSGGRQAFTTSCRSSCMIINKSSNRRCCNGCAPSIHACGVAMDAMD
jgi:hypothetical protein